MLNFRMQTWLALIVGVVALVVAVLVGLFAYMSLTARPLHPNAEDVPSVTRLPPLPKWADAVERGRQIVRQGVTDQNLPGVSVAVGAGGEIVWAEAFGWANLENRVPLEPQMRFRIGTASKALTAAAVGILLEKGRLTLDEEIQAYVPAFPKKEWAITLRHLMGHTAGIRSDAGDEEPVSVGDDAPLSVRCPRTVDGLQRFAERPLLFQPGTEYRYSNYGWILVSAAVEAAAGKPFSTFMRDQIFEPLGMHDTRAESTLEPSPDRPTFYFPQFGGDPRYGPDEGREVDYSCFSGSAAFQSTPSDLVRFAIAINGGKLLQPATIQLLQAPQRVASGKETGYALGWDLETAALAGEETRVAGHDGELMGGMVASFWTFPEGTVVAVTSNTAYADTFSLAVKVAETFAGHGKSPAPK
jgi:serine beta-lactamase-like protein LACTB, mitochondrial